jgi:integrase
MSAANFLHVAVHTGMRPSELVALRYKNVHADSITIDERCCRGDWGAPKSKASNATIPVNSGVINRIHRLKTITVEIRAGNGRGFFTIRTPLPVQECTRLGRDSRGRRP